jgi:hypothetical protein
MMPAKRNNPKYVGESAATLDIVVTKSVVIGTVTEDDGSEMSPVEATMALIGRDIDRAYAATGVSNNVDSYSFYVAGDRFLVEVRSNSQSGEAA